MNLTIYEDEAAIFPIDAAQKYISLLQVLIFTGTIVDIPTDNNNYCKLGISRQFPDGSTYIVGYVKNV